MATAPQPAEIQHIEHEYRRGIALLAARPKLEQGLLFAWLLLDVGLIVYFIVSVVLYLIAGSFAEVRQVATIGQNAGSAREAAAARAADPLLLGDVRVLMHAQGSYDLYATAENRNSEWYATVTYRFIGGGVEIGTQESVVLPGETQYLLALGTEAAARPAGAQLVVEDVVWTRVDRHAVPDTAEFLADRSDFVLSESAYAADVVLEKDTVGRSTFTVTNATAYAFYNPSFVVLLKRGGAIVAVNTVTVPSFLSGETREVEVHWFGSIPTSGSVEVLPDINVFDDRAYMAPAGEAPTDLRDDAQGG